MKVIIIFMTDGGCSENLDDQLNSIKNNYGDLVSDFWAVAFGSGADN